MRLILIFVLCLGYFIQSDAAETRPQDKEETWQEKYARRHPGTRIAANVQADSNESYFLDETETLAINGKDTTRSVSTTKNRSSYALAEELRGIKGVLQLTLAISLAAAIISVVLLAKGM